VSLPSTVAYLPPDTDRHPDYVPAPPAEQALSAQEPGIRPARAVPYELQVRADADVVNGKVTIHFGNSGTAAAVFHVRSAGDGRGPWTYTVGPRAEVSDTWVIPANGQTEYDLSVYGPNGFLRVFKGSFLGANTANLASRVIYDVARGGVTLEIRNQGATTRKVRIVETYGKDTITHSLRPGENLSRPWRLEDSFGWYDFSVDCESDTGFRQRLAGHLETGKDSMSDPALGASKQA
jgi:phospholipase C